MQINLFNVNIVLTRGAVIILLASAIAIGVPIYLFVKGYPYSGLAYLGLMGIIWAMYRLYPTWQRTLGYVVLALSIAVFLSFLIGAVIVEWQTPATTITPR